MNLVSLFVISLVIVIFTIFSSILDTNYLIKNKKLFKYIFKLSSPNPKIKDFVQIILIIILSTFLLFSIGVIGTLTPFYAFSYHSCSQSACRGTECRSLIWKGYAYLNQAVNLHKQLEGKIDYSNEKAFAQILIKRLSLVYAYNIPYKGIEKTLSKKQIKQYNLKEYENKPILYVSDSSSLMISKFESGCKNVDLVNIENSSCLIDLDVNGVEAKPNNKDVENIKKRRLQSNDRYTFIIDGNNDKVILPEVTTTFYGFKQGN